MNLRFKDTRMCFWAESLQLRDTYTHREAFSLAELPASECFSFFFLLSNGNMEKTVLNKTLAMSLSCLLEFFSLGLSLSLSLYEPPRLSLPHDSLSPRLRGPERKDSPECCEKFIHAIFSFLPHPGSIKTDETLFFSTLFPLVLSYLNYFCHWIEIIGDCSPRRHFLQLHFWSIFVKTSRGNEGATEN